MSFFALLVIGTATIMMKTKRKIVRVRKTTTGMSNPDVDGGIGECMYCVT
jgi:hypothetical protein